jgi:hypothetical protein
VFSAPLAGSGAPAVSSGPGEYTRVFGTPSSYAATEVTPLQPAPGAAPAQAAPPPQVTPPPPAPKSQTALLPVVIVSAVVLLAALALVLYFVLKK